MRRAAIVAATTLPLLMSGTAHAGLKSTSISIDNFCDVYTVSVQDKNLTAAVETDPDGNCNTFLGGGSIAKLKGLGRVAQIGGNFSGNASLVFVVDFQYPFVTGGAWHMYATSDGSVMQTITSGTYTVVTGAPSTGKAMRRMSDSTHR